VLLKKCHFSHGHRSPECRCAYDVCFAAGDEAQALDTRVFAARSVGEGTMTADTAVPSGIAEVPLDKIDAANRYF